MKRKTVNDVTQLNPIEVREIARPRTVAGLQAIIKAHKGPVSIGGGALFDGRADCDRRHAVHRHAGARRHQDLFERQKRNHRAGRRKLEKIIGYIDPDDLSVSIMQSYANFTVGGALSVNAHGRYIGQGPIIKSVKSIKVVTADGELKTASPTENRELFYGAIGGYGGLGVIVEATLDLADNVNVERSVVKMPRADYAKFFDENIKGNKDVVFHNGDFYPPDYGTITAVTLTRTDKAATVPDRLRPKKEVYLAEYLSIFAMTQIPGINKLRPKIDEKNPLQAKRNRAAQLRGGAVCRGAGTVNAQHDDLCPAGIFRAGGQAR